MFTNIGGKIKTCAKTIAVMGIVGNIISGLLVISRGGRSSSVALIGMGFAILIVGALIFWIGSFFVYGFGELVEKTHA